MDRGIHRKVMHGMPDFLHVKNAVKSKMVTATKTVSWIWQVVPLITQESTMYRAVVIVKVPKAFILVGAAGFKMDTATEQLLNSKSSVDGKVSVESEDTVDNTSLV